jgi:hypothetical protein
MDQVNQYTNDHHHYQIHSWIHWPTTTNKKAKKAARRATIKHDLTNGTIVASGYRLKGRKTIAEKANLREVRGKIQMKKCALRWVQSCNAIWYNGGCKIIYKFPSQKKSKKSYFLCRIVFYANAIFNIWKLNPCAPHNPALLLILRCRFDLLAARV